MMSLFASFDMNIFWLSAIFISLFYFITSTKFFLFSFNQILNLSLLKNFIFFFKGDKKNISEFFICYLASLFIFVFLFNFFSVGPFIFPLTSQISLILVLSLIIWLSIISFFFMNNLKMFLSHLVPETSPMILVPMLVIIELVSNLIRPLTLTVRLVANTVAGHVLMELYSDLGSKSIFMFSMYPFLIFVEILVATIQAYVFSMMTLLYLSELD